MTGFLRYASPAAAGGFGPNTVGCSNGTLRDRPRLLPGGHDDHRRPAALLPAEQRADSGIATDAAGASDITNEEFSLFVQDKWQVTPKLTLNYGLRWDAQNMPETVDPQHDRLRARSSNDPRFPSDGTIPDQTKQFQPRLGVAWDVKGNGRSVIRASAGIYYAAAEHAEPGGLGHDQRPAAEERLRAAPRTGSPSGLPRPTWPNILPPSPVPPGTFPLFTGVRVFDRDYQNPRIYSVNVAYEQELAPDWSRLRRLHLGRRAST